MLPTSYYCPILMFPAGFCREMLTFSHEGMRLYLHLIQFIREHRKTISLLPFCSPSPWMVRQRYTNCRSLAEIWWEFLENTINKSVFNQRDVINLVEKPHSIASLHSLFIGCLVFLEHPIYIGCSSISWRGRLSKAFKRVMDLDSWSMWNYSDWMKTWLEEKVKMSSENLFQNQQKIIRNEGRKR